MEKKNIENEDGQGRKDGQRNSGWVDLRRY